MRLVDADKLIEKIMEADFYAADRLDKRPHKALMMLMKMIQEAETVELPRTEGKHEAVL